MPIMDDARVNNAVNSNDYKAKYHNLKRKMKILLYVSTRYLLFT